MLFGLLGSRSPWQWRLGSSSAANPDQLAAACAALRRQGRSAAAERAAVAAHLAAAADPAAPGSAAVVQQMAQCADLMEALADVLHPSASPSQELIEVGTGQESVPPLHSCCRCRADKQPLGAAHVLSNTSTRTDSNAFPLVLHLSPSLRQRSSHTWPPRRHRALPQWAAAVLCRHWPPCSDSRAARWPRMQS